MKPGVPAPLEYRTASLKEKLPAPVASRLFGFPAKIAEFLLLARVRSRVRSALCADTLRHAAQVVLVTCKNWFLKADRD